jgi:hypothetical protein
MLEDFAAYVRAGLEALSAQGAEDAAGSIISKASSLAEQFTSFAAGFAEWSGEARATLLQEIRDLVARQIDAMGVATKDEVDALRARLDRLEASFRSATPGGRTSAPRGRASSARATPSRRVSSGSGRTTAAKRSSGTSAARTGASKSRSPSKSRSQSKSRSRSKSTATARASRRTTSNAPE